MEAGALAAGHAEHEHHGPPPANRSSRVDPSLLGMLLFIISEVMVFGAFFTAYFFIRVVQGADWPAEGTELPKLIAGVNTAILISSSFTLHWAEHAHKRATGAACRRASSRPSCSAARSCSSRSTSTCTSGFSPQDHAQGTIFYGLTGLHGAHVFIGLTLLLFVTIRAFRGHFTAEDHRGIEVPGIYWHFVDVMWIVVYTTVYII